MSGPWEDYAPQAAPTDGPWNDYAPAEAAPAAGAATSVLAGIGKGVGSTALGAQYYLGKGLDAIGLEKAGKWLQDDAKTGRERLKAELQPYKDANPLSAGAGELGGEILATLPVGGVLAKGARAVGAAPKLVSSLASSGFRTGAPAAATLRGKAADLAIRAAGGAATGGVSASLVDPGTGGAGTVIGGALPIPLKGTGTVMKYLGRSARSVVEPFTEKGQQRIAGKVLNQFAEGGPTTIDARQIVPGSSPTLAEATGNAGLAGLQRAARDVRPNSFVEREQANAAARSAAFEKIAGDAGAKEAAVLAREESAKPLYGRAFTADAMRRSLANEAMRARRPFAGVGLSGAREDLATPGLRELATRPMFKEAVKAARTLAANNGVELADPLQSLQGLHYVKLALDDALNPEAKSAMGRNASNAVMSMRDKLTEELAEVSPLYGAARDNFAEMSKPINAMDALQGLKLTDAQGNITLAKVQNAILSLKHQRAAPGTSNAKSVSKEQLDTLYAIRDDLLRQSKTSLGRSAGSNTYQNLATDNILSTLIPGKAGTLAAGRVGNVVGQVGRLAYSGPNEQIRNSLVDMMLDPKKAEAAMLMQRQLPGPTPGVGLLEAFAPTLYRAGPLLGSDR